MYRISLFDSNYLASSRVIEHSFRSIGTLQMSSPVAENQLIDIATIQIIRPHTLSVLLHLQQEIISRRRFGANCG